MQSDEVDKDPHGGEKGQSLEREKGQPLGKEQDKNGGKIAMRREKLSNGAVLESTLT